MDKNISIIGVGKLGLCLGLNLERKGFNVIGVDIFEEYIQSLNNKTYTTSEPNVNAYLQESKNITFTTDLELALKNDIISSAKGTIGVKSVSFDVNVVKLNSNNLRSSIASHSHCDSLSGQSL